MVTTVDGKPPLRCDECNRILVIDRLEPDRLLHWMTGRPECGADTGILAHLPPWGVSA